METRSKESSRNLCETHRERLFVLCIETVENQSIQQKTIIPRVHQLRTRLGRETKRDVLRVWLENAKEAKKMRDECVQATQFRDVSLKLNAFLAWKLKTSSSKRDELENAREREINEQIADTFRRVSLSQKVLSAWRVRVFNSWRERLATEMGYRTIARRVLRGWHQRVVGAC